MKERRDSKVGKKMPEGNTKPRNNCYPHDGNQVYIEALY